MTLTYERHGVTVHHGDCRDVLRELADESVHAVVTDPPYELAFMGRKWDASGIAFETDMWRECLRVLKPGGHLLAFGGSRSWHRLACAVEDAGFEVRDSIAWMYASGFPKSLDVSKAIDKAAGAEREVVGRADYPGREGWTNGPGSTVGAVYLSGVERSLAKTITAAATPEAERWQGWGTALKPAFEPIVVARKPLQGSVVQNVLEHETGALNVDACRVDSVGPNAGRWPANSILTHASLCAEGCAPGCPVRELDEQGGLREGGHQPKRRAGIGYGSSAQGTIGGSDIRDGWGSASRFFPAFRFESKAPSAERPKVDGVAHPTVKPLALMRWLVRLVTPPGGIVLDPFLGSGTTAQAARAEGFQCIGIERELEYLELIRVRLDGAEASLFDGEAS